ncbi:uncharacterized protein BDZ99DRAFT_467396 [Mytilinidion resinicola]|uniref:Aminoglycoside phosphotransferase domain-containing protein n=1 Tax=Mytilinidion resinicola TaxID=574789 RepID=A0A6A6Y9B7_9PEZI|nr:uncharacterized protein BDZ99DRAFT_467396 [Mytilinidion resinicola]KAF2804715.1 hypothetical protein BDZ99DRAFT_467396 [Mytilinidion resinicola]
MGARITRLNDDAIAKSGSRVLPREEAALRLVGKLSDVPVPKVLYSHYSKLDGDLFISLSPGLTLKDLWDTLNKKTKERLYHDIWSLIRKIRQILKPPEFNNFFLCLADGSCSQNVYIKDLESPPRPLINNAASSVFTHGDIALQNIIVDYYTYKITGLINWEFAGWYPDYWEYLRIHKPINDKNWREWMDRTALQKWDLAGNVDG